MSRLEELKARRQPQTLGELGDFIQLNNAKIIAMLLLMGEGLKSPNSDLVDFESLIETLVDKVEDINESVIFFDVAMRDNQVFRDDDLKKNQA